MNAKQLAARLQGFDATSAIPRELKQAAARAGLVVVHGPLATFVGAIEGEVILEEGGPVYVDRQGILPDYENDIAGLVESEVRDYFDRKRMATKINVICNPTPSWRWLYETAIPHETFDMNDAGEPYCRGIVFAVADLLGAA